MPPLLLLLLVDPIVNFFHLLKGETNVFKNFVKILIIFVIRLLLESLMFSVFLLLAFLLSS